jgi:hypothetical protein
VAESSAAGCSAVASVGDESVVTAASIVDDPTSCTCAAALPMLTASGASPRKNHQTNAPVEMAITTRALDDHLSSRLRRLDGLVDSGVGVFT